MPKLQLEFEVEVDGEGVVDGRELARDLIETAFKLLVPYVNGCHACADNLFAGLANDELAELHDFGHQSGQLDGHMYRLGLPQDPAAFRRHLDAADHLTRNMMWEGDKHSHH